jgi:tRNA nucleotidyltransferase (CCA-adding enzyme)
MVLQAAAKLSESLAVRFAAMVHDLGKGTTDPQYWPSHHGHERRGLDLIEKLCDRLIVPNQCRELALQVCHYHTLCHRAAQLRPDTMLRLFENTDAFRRPERFGEFLLACEADARGRKGLEDRAYPQADILRVALAAAAAVDNAAIQQLGLRGPEFGAELRKRREHAITDAIAAALTDSSANIPN